MEEQLEGETKPLFKPWDVSGVAIYLPASEATAERIEAVHTWLESRWGRPLNKGTYWFGKNCPTADEFVRQFEPLEEGEGYVLLTQGDNGIRLSVFGRAAPVNDAKIVFR